MSRLDETQLRLVIDTIPVMAWICRADGSVEFFNRRWLEYSGLSMEEALVDGGLQTLHLEDKPRVLEKWQRIFAAGEAYEDEMRLRGADGTYHWFLVRTVPLRDAAGRISGWYGASTDIQDRKRAEELAQESQQLLRQVLATLPVGVVVTDEKGDVVLINEQSARIWGTDRVIVSGAERRAASRGYWHDSGRPLAPEEWASHRAAGGQTVPNELIDIESFDGLHKTIENAAAPIRNALGRIVGAVVVHEDVTERIRAEDALRESAARLQLLSRRLLEVQEEERRHLARELHDEFGQLLSAVNFRLHSARAVAGESARAALEESIALVERVAERARGLILQLRPAILESAGLDVTLRWLAAEQMQQAGIRIDIAGESGGVPLDLATVCFRVVQEALTNVVRHASARNVRIELGREGDTLQLVVRDDGAGFDVREAAGKRGHFGLLGMRERVQNFGGELRIHSTLGRGTEVRVSIPVPASEPKEFA